MRLGNVWIDLHIHPRHYFRHGAAKQRALKQQRNQRDPEVWILLSIGKPAGRLTRTIRSSGSAS
jgi:hypothetical protein